jgi:hypothetical protein
MDLTKERSSTIRDTMHRAILDAWIDGTELDGFDITRDQFYGLDRDNLVEARQINTGPKFPFVYGQRVYVAGTALARSPTDKAFRSHPLGGDGGAPMLPGAR